MNNTASEQRGRGSCIHCGRTEEAGQDVLRPYGPGGADICFRCMKATPEREQQAHNAFGALMDGEIAATGVAIITDNETRKLLGGPR